MAPPQPPTTPKPRAPFSFRGWLKGLEIREAIAILIGLFLFVGFFWMMLGPHTSDQTKQGDHSAEPAIKTPPVLAPDSPETLNNGDALLSRYGEQAKSECEPDVEDYLKSISQYDYKWSVGTFTFKFDRYLPTVSSPGILTMVSDKAMLQNRFGAFERTKIYCKYDTQNRKVLGYSIDKAVY